MFKWAVQVNVRNFGVELVFQEQTVILRTMKQMNHGAFGWLKSRCETMVKHLKELALKKHILSNMQKRSKENPEEKKKKKKEK